MEVLDRWSWDQVQLVAECIALHKVQQLEMVLGPIAAGLGTEYKPGSVSSPSGAVGQARKRGRTTLDYSDPAAVKRAQQRDMALKMAARKEGIRYE